MDLLRRGIRIRFLWFMLLADILLGETNRETVERKFELYGGGQ
jgi:hypothetical protein